MSERLLSGWYIILYHDVSWEESPHVRHVSETCPPDVFRDHVESCASLGRLISIQEGMERISYGAIEEPLFSFWFDDGLAGVRKYAAPILAKHGITGAISVCSRFARRSEMFWRFKLSYLRSIGADHRLREKLYQYGCAASDRLRQFTLDKFGPEILVAIDAVYDEMVSRSVQEEAFGVFDTPDGLLSLKRQGWIIANHSAAHYPIGEKRVNDIILQQFEECELFIKKLTATEKGYWVFPFDRDIEPNAIELVRERHPEHTVVLVRDLVNGSCAERKRRILYRIYAPPCSRARLKEILISASRKLPSERL